MKRIMPVAILSALAGIGASQMPNLGHTRGPSRTKGLGRNYWDTPRYRPKTPRTEEDFAALEAAKQRRERRGAKYRRDYNRCLVENPCRRAV